MSLLEGANVAAMRQEIQSLFKTFKSFNRCASFKLFEMTVLQEFKNKGQEAVRFILTAETWTAQSSRVS